MADLLECVIQIKALADTPRRLALRLAESMSGGASDPLPLLHDLLAYEAWLQGSVEAGLAASDPLVAAEPRFDRALLPTSPTESPGALLARFAARRELTVRRLDSLTAAELCAGVRVSGRGRTTVADLVALTLAHDTDCIALIVRSS